MSSGKRGPSAPLATTSDEEDQQESTDSSQLNTSTDVTNSSLEYENVSSPCSSTASGPVYVRPPGFTHHAQEIVRRSKVKKKKPYLTEKDGIKRREPTPPKYKPKRESVPMRLRALPQSFWQQPNKVHNAPPGNCFAVLPPLSSKDSQDELMAIRPVTPPQEKDVKPADTEVKRPVAQRPAERKLTVSKQGEEMMIKLFHHVQQEEQKKHSSQSQLRRGRPKKIISTSKKGFLNADDPYLMEAVTHKLFPQLSLETGIRQPTVYSSSGSIGNTSLQLVTVRDGDKSITLPSLCVEQNYSQMLTELVSHI